MRRLRITIENKSYDVTVEDLTEPGFASPSLASTPRVSPITTPPPTTEPRKKLLAHPALPVEAGAVTSPMAGAIKSVLVQPAEQVQERQPLVILEAMKMENQITAPRAGTVREVKVRDGDTVLEGQVLLTLE